MAGDMFVNGNISTLLECKTRYGVTESDRFKYFQLRHWLLHRDVKGAVTRALTLFEKWVRRALGSRGITSQLYAFLTPTTDVDRVQDVSRWETLAGCPISPKYSELV